MSLTPTSPEIPVPGPRRRLSTPLRRLRRRIPQSLRRSTAPAQIAIVLMLAVAAGLAHVHLRLVVLRAGYELSRQTRLKAMLQDQNQKLRLELATRHDPSMIERRAREELGMTPPDPGSIRVLPLDPAVEARP